MRFLRQATLLLALLTAPLFAAATDVTRVQTEGGELQGLQAAGVREFRGIPFAAPPLGALRWESPAAPASWQGTRSATAFRSACPQVSRYDLTEASDDEDCLYLNVATPLAIAAPDAKLPVLVWIHGGAFVGGGANLYPLDHLARQAGLVVVSINYRLGPLGFLAHPALPSAAEGALALEDQRAALAWVQRNIAAFGGDPANVTLAGESAGGASVCLQLATPERSRGLFHKAIVQSAACTVLLRSVEQARATGLALAERLGCTDAATALPCLRARSAHDLAVAGYELGGADVLAFAPSTGSAALPRDGGAAFSSGEFLRVPILNGGNRDEMRLYVAYDIAAGKPVNAGNYEQLIGAIYGQLAPEVLKRYPLDAFPAAPAALGTVFSDHMPGGPLGNCQFLRTARLAVRHVPVYQYEFTDRAAPPVAPDPGFEMGAVHSAELPYFFPRFSNKSVYDGPDLAPASQRLSARMVAYWAAFARSGDPAVAGLPAWPPFSAGGAVQWLGAEGIRAFDADALHHCAFWRASYPQELGD